MGGSAGLQALMSCSEASAGPPIPELPPQSPSLALRGGVGRGTHSLHQAVLGRGLLRRLGLSGSPGVSDAEERTLLVSTFL